MTEVRLAVERDHEGESSDEYADDRCCPRCVATEGYEEAPDLSATAGEHPLPTEALGKPRPAGENVQAFGWFCTEHDVFFAIPYNEANDRDLLGSGTWIAAPIHTETGYPMLVPIRHSEMVGELT